MTEHDIAAVAPSVITILVGIIFILSGMLKRANRRVDFYVDAWLRALGLPVDGGTEKKDE